MRPETPAEQNNAARVATIALLVATLLWGCGFTWAKVAGETVNRILGTSGSPLGPVWVLAMRFFAAGILWFIVFPDSRRGWNRSVAWRTIALGAMLSIGMVVQHIGLDRTSEAVSAFLTSLTILFVPVLMSFIARPPAGVVWGGVALAGVGVYLMTGASGGTFGLGEALGLACAVAYSIDIIMVNYLVKPGEATKITGGQFLVVGFITLVTTLLLPRGAESLSPGRIVELFSVPQISVNVALMAVFVSMGAFGLQFRFQPHIDPTRAALLYLMEPIFASMYAWIVAGRGLTRTEMLGAGLILAANLMVEALQARKRRQERGFELVDAPPIID
jgi:drug/metabolite transporter (DMT)-like permease